MEQNFGIKVDDPLEDWVKKLKAKGIEIDGTKVSKTQLINIVGDLVEPETETHPVFVVDMFKEFSPLAKSKKGEPGIVERFELYMGGMEIANAYGELTDSVEQRKRFEEAQEIRAENAFIPYPFPEDFFKALESGMPECSGCALGVDRLAMIFTDTADIAEIRI